MNMKKSIMFMLLLLTNIVAMAQEFVEVSSAAEFKTAAEGNKNIKLTADIDLTTIGTISNTYKGIIDGEGVKEINGKEEKVFYSLGNGKNRVTHPIFEKIEGATLKNLVIQYFRIEWDDDDIGAVAYTAKNCNFNQVILSEISIFNDDDEAGAIVGMAENCDFRNVKGMGNDVTVDGNRAGGFVGLSVKSVYCNCSNSAMSTVYSDGSWGNAYAGGFVGESKSDQFVFCVNFACVGALDDRIGGIVGYSTKSFFTNCSNSGYIMHCEEKDFLTCTGRIKANLTDRFNTIIADLEKQYGHQNFDLTAGFASFIGTLGLSAVTFGVELCLLSVATGGIGAFTVTVIVAATGIVVTLINLIDAEIGAHDEMGGICGSCETGVFDCCSNYGTLMCRDSYVGGIVGLMRDMPVKSKIINCLNAGEIRGFESMGGIFGEGNPTDVVTKCLNVGKLTPGSKDSKSDPIGCVLRGDYGMSQCYYLADQYDANAMVRIPVDAERLKNGTVATWLNEGATSQNAPWHQTPNVDSYPMPDPSHNPVNPQKHDDVFAISSVEDLIAFREAVNSGTKDSYVVYIDDDIDCLGKDLEPIGTLEHPFTGICYGNGHTISNFNISKDAKDKGVGFFGVVGLNTEVYALNIGSGSITGGYGVGAIIGCAEHVNDTEGYIKIIGCSNAATITSNFDCGGIIGAVYSDKLMKLTLDNCYNMGSVNANSKSAALCGFAKKNALVTSCWNLGTVTGNETGKGFVRGDTDAAPEIHNCYNAASLTSLFQGKEVYSFTPEDAKNGTLCFKLNGGSNDTSVGLPWEQNIVSDAYPKYVGYSEVRKGVFTSRMITNKYGTVVLPYTVQSDNNIKYYILTNVDDGTETQFHFSAVDKLPAGTPAIFCYSANKPSTYEFISVSNEFSDQLNAIKKSEWTMTGNLDINGKDIVFTDANELESLYYISEGQIKSASTQLTIAPFSVYINGSSCGGTSDIHTFSVRFDDNNEPTNILLVPEDVQEYGMTNGIYNLAGQRLNALQNGFNIVNGKKIIIK